MKAIEQRLSYFSKTSPEEVDIGIDLRCELIEHDEPTIQFFVQAKGTEHFEDSWSRGIKKSTVFYWLMQRFPVYIIVYDDRTDECYWMSIEDQRYSLFQKLGEKDNDTVSLKLERSHILERGKDKNGEFISKIKDDLRSIQQFLGYPQVKGNGYVKTIPPPPRSEFEMVQTKENIRISLYSIVQRYMKESDVQNALLCCRFLGEFDKSHYNHFVWLGQIYQTMGNFEEAKEAFNEALRICKRDTRWPSDSMQRIISAIKKEIEMTDTMQSART